jgi:hypothetical protein
MALNQTQTRRPILSMLVIFCGYLLSKVANRQPGAASTPDDQKEVGFFSQLLTESKPARLAVSR